MALCLSSSAWGQTGVSTQTGVSATRLATLPANVAPAGPESGPLSHLEGQPQLAKHLSRINQFRTLFRNNSQRSPQQKETASGRLMADAVVVPRTDATPETNVADLAITALEESRSARRYPSTFYPGVGVVFALKTISNLSEDSMISALRTGATPIYDQSGEVIGVQHPRTGLLLGGRRS